MWRTAAAGSGRPAGAAAAGAAREGDGAGCHVLVLREEAAGPRQGAGGADGVDDVGERLAGELEREVEPGALGHDGRRSGTGQQRQLPLSWRARPGTRRGSTASLCPREGIKSSSNSRLYEQNSVRTFWYFQHSLFVFFGNNKKMGGVSNS